MLEADESKDEESKEGEDYIYENHQFIECLTTKS